MNLYEDYYDEVPRHRKKKKKSIKKSNHKHIYEPHRIDSSFDVIGCRDKEVRKWVFIIYKCKLCDKEKLETKTLSKEEFKELEEKLQVI